MGIVVTLEGKKTAQLPSSSALALASCLPGSSVQSTLLSISAASTVLSAGRKNFAQNCFEAKCLLKVDGSQSTSELMLSVGKAEYTKLVLQQSLSVLRDGVLLQLLLPKRRQGRSQAQGSCLAAAAACRSQSI